MPLRRPAKNSRNAANQIGKARPAAMIGEATVDKRGELDQITGW